VAEFQLATSFRTRKRFALSDYFTGVKDTTKLNIIDVRQNVPFQRDNGKKRELDVTAESDCGRVIVVEVKKTKDKTGALAVQDFYEKIKSYSNLAPEKNIMPAFLSLGGFTDEAAQFCEEKGIAVAEYIAYF
jgi:hypothetical protein